MRDPVAWARQDKPLTEQDDRRSADCWIQSGESRLPVSPHSSLAHPRQPGSAWAATPAPGGGAGRCPGVAGAQVRGDRVGSAEIELAPGPVRSGDYFFDIGTAGATSLVLQTLLLPLALAPAHRASPSAAAPTRPGAPVSTTWIGSGGQSSLASTSPSI